jgi:hypothetical protein
MLSEGVVRELQTQWFPHLTDTGLDRLIQLLESDSPFLIHGCFIRATPMGCLATHAAWHHPRTEHLTHEAGIAWLTRVAGLNPATSLVIREWDARPNWQCRAELLQSMRDEREHRLATHRRCLEPERISDASLILSPTSA